MIYGSGARLAVGAAGALAGAGSAAAGAAAGGAARAGEIIQYDGDGRGVSRPYEQSAVQEQAIVV